MTTIVNRTSTKIDTPIGDRNSSDTSFTKEAVDPSASARTSATLQHDLNASEPASQPHKTHKLRSSATRVTVSQRSKRKRSGSEPVDGDDKVDEGERTSSRESTEPNKEEDKVLETNGKEVKQKPKEYNEDQKRRLMEIEKEEASVVDYTHPAYLTAIEKYEARKKRAKFLNELKFENIELMYETQVEMLSRDKEFDMAVEKERLIHQFESKIKQLEYQYQQTQDPNYIPKTYKPPQLPSYSDDEQEGDVKSASSSINDTAKMTGSDAKYVMKTDEYGYISLSSNPSDRIVLDKTRPFIPLDFAPTQFIDNDAGPKLRPRSAINKAKNKKLAGESSETKTAHGKSHTNTDSRIKHASAKLSGKNVAKDTVLPGVSPQMQLQHDNIQTTKLDNAKRLRSYSTTQFIDPNNVDGDGINTVVTNGNSWPAPIPQTAPSTLPPQIVFIQIPPPGQQIPPTPQQNMVVSVSPSQDPKQHPPITRVNGQQPQKIWIPAGAPPPSQQQGPTQIQHQFFTTADGKTGIIAVPTSYMVQPQQQTPQPNIIYTTGPPPPNPFLVSPTNGIPQKLTNQIPPPPKPDQFSPTSINMSPTTPTTILNQPPPHPQPRPAIQPNQVSPTQQLQSPNMTPQMKPVFFANGAPPPSQNGVGPKIFIRQMAGGNPVILSPPQGKFVQVSPTRMQQVTKPDAGSMEKVSGEVVLKSAEVKGGDAEKAVLENEGKGKRVKVENSDKSKVLTPFDDVTCLICGKGERDYELLLCDYCSAGKHYTCMNPAVKLGPDWQLPADGEDWFCSENCANKALEEETKRKKNTGVGNGGVKILMEGMNNAKGMSEFFGVIEKSDLSVC
ncbi:hypothetical protein HK098_002993 [Nowakowskiella sp. JEL0407]|nr:hypothetical protein HK098_002993 [Nowakowskiella sp. JEL0407]